MKTITAKSPHDSSFSFSRRYFHWKKKVDEDDYDDNDEEILTFSSSSHACGEELKVNKLAPSVPTQKAIVKAPRMKLPTVAVSKLRSAIALFSKRRSHLPSGLGTRVVGTLFGYRRGHVHLAFQEDPKLSPAFMVELATPTSVLVREMASGLVRIALECEKKTEKKCVKLLEEPIWRTFCNGKKCGYAVRRECGLEEWKVLKAVGRLRWVPVCCRAVGMKPVGPRASSCT